MGLKLTTHQTRLLRLKCQCLLFPEADPSAKDRSASPEKVLGEVVAVQAQDLPAARLSIWARSAGLTAASVEQARQEQRSIVWTWSLRGTMHLISSQDAAWLIPFLGPQFIAASSKRLRQLGWDEPHADAGLKLLHSALIERGGLTRPEIISLLKDNNLPFEGQAPIHLIRKAALEGILCLGADQQSKPTYVHYETWLGRLQPLAPQEALVEIAVRYLKAFGPAPPEDLSTWSGLKVTQAREAWQLIAHRLVTVEQDGKAMWMLKDLLPLLDELLESLASRKNDYPPVVRLLPAYDTYLLGYTNRDVTVAAEFAKHIHPGGGIIHPVVLVDGRAIGTWQIKPRRNFLEIVIAPFERLASELLPHIEAQVASLARFLDNTAVMKITPRS